MTLDPLPDLLVQPIIRTALAEDLGRAGDITGQACVPADARLTADFVARRGGVVAGLACMRLTLAEIDPTATMEALSADGLVAPAGSALARVSGNARAILTAERTALNLLGRLCGIATLTQDYVDAVAGTKARITDTRKTTPGLRAKDNHVAACGSVGEAVRRAKAFAGHLVKVEVEVDSLNQLQEALAGDPDVIMLDNFELADMREAVRIVDGRLPLEASGGVTLETVREIAETGVDVISVGALTHSVRVLDIGLDAVEG